MAKIEVKAGGVPEGIYTGKFSGVSVRRTFGDRRKAPGRRNRHEVEWRRNAVGDSDRRDKISTKRVRDQCAEIR